MTNFDKYLNEQMKDDEFRREYEAMQPEFAVIQAYIDAQNGAGLSQAELSELTGITQNDIGDLENVSSKLSLKSIQQLAEAMGKHLKIEFV